MVARPLIEKLSELAHRVKPRPHDSPYERSCRAAMLDEQQHIALSPREAQSILDMASGADGGRISREEMMSLSDSMIEKLRAVVSCGECVGPGPIDIGVTPADAQSILDMLSDLRYAGEAVDRAYRQHPPPDPAQLSLVERYAAPNAGCGCIDGAVSEEPITKNEHIVPRNGRWEIDK